MRKILWTFREFSRITSTPIGPSQTSPHGGQNMRTNRFAIFTTALLLVGLVLAVTVAAADQHSGTWKMNPTKSKYSPGPAPTSTTVKVDADEKGVKIDAEGTNADGSALHVQYDAKFDGKTRTSTFKGKDAEGHDVLNVVVSDKQ